MLEYRLDGLDTLFIKSSPPYKLRYLFSVISLDFSTEIGAPA